MDAPPAMPLRVTPPMPPVPMRPLVPALCTELKLVIGITTGGAICVRAADRGAWERGGAYSGRRRVRCALTCMPVMLDSMLLILVPMPPAVLPAGRPVAPRCACSPAASNSDDVGATLDVDRSDARVRLTRSCEGTAHEARRRAITTCCRPTCTLGHSRWR